MAGLHGFMRKDLVNKEQTVTMECDTLQSRLDDAGITHIDYMSLDIEGAEFEALKGVDWERTTFDVLTIEHPEGSGKMGLKKLLRDKGFVAKIWLNGVDMVYVHKDANEKMKWIDEWMATVPWKEEIPCTP